MDAGTTAVMIKGRLLFVLGIALWLVSCQGATETAAPSPLPAASEPAASEPGGVSSAAPSAPASEPTAAASVAGDVNVLLSEWIVEPDPVSAPAGDLTIVADDQGGDIHELVIVRANGPSELPTDADGAVDENAIPQADFIGEIEELEPGTSRAATFALESGTYVFFCNVVEEEDDGTVEAHFAEGMHATFTAEG